MVPRPLTLTLFTCAFFSLVVSDSEGRRWNDGLEGEIDGMSYRYYLPADYDNSIEYPLVLFLHGSGESGTDNDRQVRFFPTTGLIDKTESEYPAIFVAPQLPRSVGWSPFRRLTTRASFLPNSSIRFQSTPTVST